MTNDTPQKSLSSRKPYQRPAIVYDARLEAQAGSPLGDDPLQELFDQDVLGLNK